jgi:hypothetical protein
LKGGKENSGQVIEANRKVRGTGHRRRENSDRRARKQRQETRKQGKEAIIENGGRKQGQEERKHGKDVRTCRYWVSPQKGYILMSIPTLLRPLAG